MVRHNREIAETAELIDFCDLSALCG